jgi:uncharacterized RDD family membrane protein YckC
MNPSPPDVAPRRLRRFACMMYEAVLLFGVLFITDYLLDTLTQSRSGLTLRDIRQAVLFVAVGAYFVLCWRVSGQTLPMKTWHIRLVDRHGHPPGVPRLILRYVLACVLPLAATAAIWAIKLWSGWPAAMMLVVAAPFSIFLGSWFSSDGQFLHDRILGTRLVDAPPDNTKRVSAAPSA